MCAHAYIVYDHQLNIHVGSNELIFCDARAKCVSGRVIAWHRCACTFVTNTVTMLACIRANAQRGLRPRSNVTFGTRSVPKMDRYLFHRSRVSTLLSMHEYSFGLVGRVHKLASKIAIYIFAKVDIDNSPSIKNKWIILVRELKEFSLEYFHFLRRFFPTRLEYSFGRWTWVQLSRVVLESH